MARRGMTAELHRAEDPRALRRRWPGAVRRQGPVRPRAAQPAGRSGSRWATSVNITRCQTRISSLSGDSSRARLTWEIRARRQANFLRLRERSGATSAMLRGGPGAGVCRCSSDPGARQGGGGRRTLEPRGGGSAVLELRRSRGGAGGRRGRVGGWRAHVLEIPDPPGPRSRPDRLRRPCRSSSSISGEQHQPAKKEEPACSKH